MRSSNKQIWVLEDSLESRQVFEEILELRFKIKCFENLVAFESHWLNSGDRPDLILVDLRLPDGNFLNFIKSQTDQRRLFPPFIVVSSVDDLDVIRTAFEYGALDYLVKPFKKTELLVKIERLLSENLSYQGFIAPITIDPIRMLVKRKNGACVKLTTKELQIFTLLHEAQDKRMCRAEILQKVWKVLPNSEKTLDVHISNLRQKINELSLDIIYISPDIYAIVSSHNKEL